MPSAIRFWARLLRPKLPGNGEDWTFILLPRDASLQLPSRGLVSVEGTFQGYPFQATLEPDGEGGHWLKVSEALRTAARLVAGQEVELELTPSTTEPEPEVPCDLARALAQAGDRARQVWSEITPVARRDWIHWIVSGKRAETRVKRIEVACSKLAAGKRRPCCFDRSGMYSKSLSRPKAEGE